MLDAFVNTPGFSVTVISDDFDRTNRKIDARLLAKADRSIKVKSIDSLEEVVQAAEKIKLFGGADFVFAATERAQYTAGIIGEILAAKNISLMQSLKVRNKVLMKDLLTAQGVSVAEYCLVRNDEFSNCGWNAIKMPIVCKPVDGVGSKATAIIRTIEEKQKFTEQLEGSDLTFIEEFVDGTEFHADAVWVDGKCIYISVSQYFEPVLHTVYNPEKGGSFHLPFEKNQKFYQNVIELHQSANQALDFVTGISHLEFFVDHHGQLIFSEMAGRLAGGGIDDMIRVQSGMSLSEWLARGLKGELLEIQPVAENARYVGWFNACPKKSGRIISMLTENDILSLSGVRSVRFVKTVGEFFEFKHPSWCILFCIQADSPKALLENGRKLIEQINIAVSL
jgi:biotin carboxylase